MSDESLEITEKGRAVIESGLTLRQAHEIETGCTSEHLCESCLRAVHISWQVIERGLRARIAELEAQLDRVREVHQPIEAVNMRYPGGRRTEVCSGCGTDDGNWQIYPCPTIRALNGPRPVSKLREVQP